MYHYMAFGLVISSELELSELLSTEAGLSDVSITCGAVPEFLENPEADLGLYQVANQQLLLKIDGVARFMVSHGTEIVVDVAPGSDADAVRLFLLGSSFGALLFQRGLVPFHGSAIATEKGVVVFSGDSGHGKSTLAGAFHLRGYPVLSDDVSAITIIEGKPCILPAYPRLMLWSDAVERLQMPSSLLRPAMAQLEKFHFDLGQGFCNEPTPLHAIYILQLGKEPELSISSLNGFEKIKTLTDNTYRGQFLFGMKMASSHFRHISVVAEQAKVAILKRPDHSYQLEELVNLVQDDFLA